MDFEPDARQQEMVRAVREGARALAADVEDRDAEGAFSRAGWRGAAELGIQGMPVPQAYGGRGADVLSTVLALEAFGYGCADTGLGFLLAAQLWSVQLPLLRFGGEAQKARWLPPLCRGEMVGVHCMTEPDSGSDAFSLRTRAVRDDARGGWTLHGRKSYVSGAPVADLALVFATVDPAAGQWGITAFLVDARAPGVALGPGRAKLGLRTTPMGDVELDGAFVPDHAVLGAVGGGAAMFSMAMQHERGCIPAVHLGVMRRQLEEAVDEARRRERFGRRIGEFQSVSNRIADMAVRLEAARLLVYRAAWLLDRGRDAEVEASAAKLFATEAALESSLDAVRTFGGAGYLAGGGPERQLRDAVGGTLYSGTSDIQRLLIARRLGLGERAR